MDFSFTQDQLLIAETADSFLASVSSSADIRLAMESELGFDKALWSRVASEMGWPLTHIPEAYDGLGLGQVELCILFERIGQNLLCAPFFSTVALGVNTLLLAGSESQKVEHLAKIANEAATYTLAYAGITRSWGSESVSAEYRMTDSGVVISGEFHYVVDGHTSDNLIVAAREKNGSQIGLFVIPTENVQRIWTPSMDQTRKLAKLIVTDLELPSSAKLEKSGAPELLEQVLSLASIAMAAEQVGVAEKSLQLTVDYIAERKQFGRVVGSFQAMKHKAADMMNRVEAARSAIYYAACIADEFMQGSPLGEELHEAASIAKAYACDAAFFNAGSAMQMHGGVGFTWEYDVHLYFKRAKAAQVSFGDSAWHKERIAKIALGEAS